MYANEAQAEAWFKVLVQVSVCFSDSNEDSCKASLCRTEGIITPAIHAQNHALAI
jgi:hypothetical protein